MNDVGDINRPEQLTITIELAAWAASRVNVFIARHQSQHQNTHGRLSMETLVRMLLEDVAFAVQNPSSWDGHLMALTLSNHGYMVADE